jgi:hypothetical protein
MNINIISFQNKFEVGADAVSCPYMVKYVEMHAYKF